MVFLNDKKFACESCIKGHRSSACHHTDRPLFEIKKKGRPVSQCEKCRELRKTKRMHSKCTCSADPDAGSSTGFTQPLSASQGSSTAKSRFKPIAPALPNGLKDAFAFRNSSDSIPADPRSKVDTLLNPCHCGKSVWKCKCHALNPDSIVNTSSISLSQTPATTNGLATLAQAAALCCGRGPSAGTQPIAPSVNSVSAPSTSDEQAINRKHARECCGGHSRAPSPSHSPHHKRNRPVSLHMLPAKGPDLPPIRLPIRSPSFAPPTFPTIPSISVITSLAGSSCSCGLQCACPGCVEHRGQQHASKDFNDCADGCGTCVDHTGGVELPSGLPAPSFIDAFFARAATLPMPPPSRTASLDPTNVTVYPPQLFSGEPKEREERGAAFGLVAVPRLVCNCKGGCGCPEGQCACGDACAGCCDDKSGPVESPSIIEGTAATCDDVDALSVPRGGTIPVVANCCGGR